jgi:hypothetical protein
MVTLSTHTGQPRPAKLADLAADKDLLVLDKPFGIETIRPPEFLRRFNANP